MNLLLNAILKCCIHRRKILNSNQLCSALELTLCHILSGIGEYSKYVDDLLGF